jgi:hypothetical protein
MQHRAIVSWQADKYDFIPKANSWYWAVGIIAGAAAIAAIILADYLFAVIALLGGFSVMLLGSSPPKRHTYRLTDRGFMIGERLIPYRDMVVFAIHEGEQPTLNIETTTLMGIVSVPLGNTDRRVIEMELKNQNIEEVESLRSFINAFASGIGL